MANFNGNTALLVAAPILQDYFSDNATDAAMSAGVITCYRDNSRTTLKNWYYQTGQPGAYTYTALPNPLTLSAAGTITDAMGNDTIPFWYPYSEVDNVTAEPYYVTVDNSNGQRQFTRQNFPFIAGSVSTNATLRNLVVNNVFWRNQGSVALTSPTTTYVSPINNAQTYYSTVLAPSQHDGFVNYMADMIFAKNATSSSNDVATFTQFPNSGSNNARLTGAATPEYYLNMSATNTGTSETIKFIQIPICLHTDNLSDYANASISIWTQATVPSATNTISVNLFQFLGTGITSVTVPALATITPSTTWQQTIIQFRFPVATLPTGGVGDDGWFLQLGLPCATAYNMNIAKPSVYLTSNPPTDDFDTYEFVSGTIDSPRTGDVRSSINTYTPFGWVPMTDGTICNAGTITKPTGVGFARQNADTWPLYSLIWNAYKNYDHAGTNVIAQMYDSTGATTSYGATAIADFVALKQLALTKMLGRVILGTAPFASLYTPYVSSGTGTSVTGKLLITTADTTNFFNGMPITFTGAPAVVLINTVYYVTNFNQDAKTFNVSNTYADAIATNSINYGGMAFTGFSVYGGLTATYSGEYSHTQSPAELVQHSHQITITGDGVTDSTVGSGGGAAKAPATTANTPGVPGLPFNVTQPNTFMNIYMKL